MTAALGGAGAVIGWLEGQPYSVLFVIFLATIAFVLVGAAGVKAMLRKPRQATERPANPAATEADGATGVQETASPRPSPDWPIHEAMNYLVHVAMLRASDADPYTALRAARQAAVDGEIAIWGRHEAHFTAEQMDRPLVRLPETYWHKYRLEPLWCFQDGRPDYPSRTELDDSRDEGEGVHVDLHLSQQQVCAKWPPMLASSGGEA